MLAFGYYRLLLLLSKMYQNEEKFDMLKCFIDSNENCHDAGELYLQRYPERQQPYMDIYPRIKRNLITYGAFSKPRVKIYDVRRDKELEELGVLGELNNNNTTSIRQLESRTGLSYSTVHRIFKKHKFNPYRTRKVHRLFDRDFQPRMDYCHWFLESTQVNQNFPLKILYTDEAHVSSNGLFNRYNSYTWAQENPHVTVEMVNQGRFGFNVWAGVFSGQIVGPYIFNENLNHHRYIEIVEDIVEPFFENMPLINYAEPFYYQQDGAPSHTARAVTNFLDRLFGEYWIGSRGPVNWPARSPDLTLCDFYLWGKVKDKTFRHHPENRQDLEDHLLDAFDSLRNIELINAARHTSKRCRLCIRENGHHFEHLL